MSDVISAPPSAPAAPAPAAPAAPAGGTTAPAAPAAPRVNPLRQPPPAAPGTPSEPGTPLASPAAPQVEVVAEPTAASPTFKVKVDGKFKEVSLDELQRGYIAGETWTQRSQRLAAEKRQWEAQRAQERQQLQHTATQFQQTQQLLTNPAALYRHLTMLAQQTGWTPDGPDAMAQPITAGQVHTTLQQREALLQKQIEQRVSSAVSNLERQFRAREIAAHKSVFEKYLDGFVKENSHIADVYDEAEFKRNVREEAGAAVRYAAESGQPVEDWNDYSLQQLTAAAERRLERIKPYLANKAKLTAASTPATPHIGIQPPGGAPVVAQPRGAYKPGSPEMKAAFEEYLAQQGWQQ